MRSTLTTASASCRGTRWRSPPTCAGSGGIAGNINGNWHGIKTSSTRVGNRPKRRATLATPTPSNRRSRPTAPLDLRPPVPPGDAIDLDFAVGPDDFRHQPRPGRDAPAPNAAPGPLHTHLVQPRPERRERRMANPGPEVKLSYT